MATLRLIPWPWLRELAWPAARQHPWRQALAVVSIALGVALAFAVHLINASALAEFASAVRSVSGQPDLVLRGGAGGFDEALYARVAARPDVEIASPVVEVQTYALDAAGRRFALRVLGLDALVAAQLAPGLAPRPATPGAGPASLFAPDAVFVNASASQQLGAGAIRQHPVEDQQLEALLLQRVQGRRDGAEGAGGMPRPFQPERDQRGLVRVVFRDADVHG